MSHSLYNFLLCSSHSSCYCILIACLSCTCCNLTAFHSSCRSLRASRSCIRTCSCNRSSSSWGVISMAATSAVILVWKNDLRTFRLVLTLVEWMNDELRWVCCCEILRWCRLSTYNLECIRMQMENQWIGIYKLFILMTNVSWQELLCNAETFIFNCQLLV